MKVKRASETSYVQLAENRIEEISEWRAVYPGRITKGVGGVISVTTVD